MSNVIVRHVESAEIEIGLGVTARTPDHYVIAWGEYADQGEADGEIRVFDALDADGDPVTDRVIAAVRDVIELALQAGHI